MLGAFQTRQRDRQGGAMVAVPAQPQRGNDVSGLGRELQEAEGVFVARVDGCAEPPGEPEVPAVLRTAA